MRTLKNLFVLMLFLSFNLFSCSIQDEIINEDDSEISATNPSNQDDDPEIEEPKG